MLRASPQGRRDVVATPDGARGLQRRRQAITTTHVEQGEFDACRVAEGLEAGFEVFACADFIPHRGADQPACEAGFRGVDIRIPQAFIRPDLEGLPIRLGNVDPVPLHGREVYRRAARRAGLKVSRDNKRASAAPGRVCSQARRPASPSVRSMREVHSACA